MSNRNYDVTALGELLIDFTENGTSAQGNPIMEANPGGAPCNVLAMLERLGKKTAFIGKVGKDMFGNQLKAAVEEVGIDTRALIMDEEVHTTLAFVHTYPDGDRDFSFYRNPGADMMLTKDEVPDDLIRDSRIFHFGTLSSTHEGVREATRHAIEVAKEAGCIITFDPNLRPPLWRSPDDAREQMLWGLGQADVVKLSDNEVGFLFGLSPREGAAYIRERFGTQLVFVTCGADGCEFASLRAQGHVDGLKGLTVTDTTGAGDIFGGCAVWRLLQSGKAPAALDEAELRGIAEFACCVAGRSTEKSGGISAITEMPDEVFMG